MDCCSLITLLNRSIVHYELGQVSGSSGFLVNLVRYGCCCCAVECPHRGSGIWEIYQSRQTSYRPLVTDVQGIDRFFVGVVFRYSWHVHGLVPSHVAYIQCLIVYIRRGGSAPWHVPREYVSVCRPRKAFSLPAYHHPLTLKNLQRNQVSFML